MEKNSISPPRKKLTKKATTLTREMEEEKNLGFFFKKIYRERLEPFSLNPKCV
jgi:hypothetical protein